MIVTVLDYGKVNGGINWTNPRTDEGVPREDIDAEEHERICDAVVEQVRAWRGRPMGKATYDFYVRL